MTRRLGSSALVLAGDARQRRHIAALRQLCPGGTSDPALTADIPLCATLEEAAGAASDVSGAVSSRPSSADHLADNTRWLYPGEHGRHLARRRGARLPRPCRDVQFGPLECWSWARCTPDGAHSVAQRRPRTLTTQHSDVVSRTNPAGRHDRRAIAKRRMIDPLVY